MPPLPAAAENFLQLCYTGPTHLMSTLRSKASGSSGRNSPADEMDVAREKQLQNGNETSPMAAAENKNDVQAHPNNQDPFTNYITMEVGDWVQLVIGTIFLLPIRALGVVLALLLAWLVAKVGLIGLSKEEAESVVQGRTGWRRKLMRVYAGFGNLVFFVAGFRVSVKGVQASRREAPILVGAPHSSFLEAVIMIMCESSPVSRLESKNAILISTIQKFYQALYVDRRTAESRQEAKDLIKARALSGDDNLPQLFLCPEGTNTNRRALIQFKLGAFSPGVPVQPVAIRYPGHDRIDSVTWTFNQKHSYMFSLWYLLSSPINRVEIQFLPVYTPSKEEAISPELFAKNVQLRLAEALSLPSTDITFTKYYNDYCAQHNLIDNNKATTSSGSSNRHPHPSQSGDSHSDPSQKKVL